MKTLIVVQFLILLISSRVSSAAEIINYQNSVAPNFESASVNKYNSRYNCNLYELLCDVTYGLKMAESSGVNGIILSGYAYHLFNNNVFQPFHIPDGEAFGKNEMIWGAGYSRTFYNPNYNSEYALYFSGFTDSDYKPQIQAGYYFQKFINLSDNGLNKFGYGYNAAIVAKPSFTGNIPIPMPMIFPMASLKIHDVSLQLNYAYFVFALTVQIDLPQL